MATDLAPDWILKQALEAQKRANVAWVNGKPELDDGGLTLTVLGCGTMGTAVLKGMLRCNANDTSTSVSVEPRPPTTTNETPLRLPSKFNACVRSRESAIRVKAELGNYNARLKIYEDDNLGPIQAGDVILLCCQPQMVGDILRAEGVREALASKLLISICAGFTESQIHEILYPNQVPGTQACTIVRAMPNIAAAIGESMTVISTPTSTPTNDFRNLITWIFTRIGQVLHLPASMMDACTALCGSGPALVALMVESLAAGATAAGLPREEAYTLAVQTMRGATGLLLQGEHTATLRDKVSTPGGRTVDGVAIMEEEMVRGTIAKTLREATVTASRLGPAKQDIGGDIATI